MQNFLIASLLTSLSTLGAYVVIDEVLTQHIDTAFKRAAAVSEINHRQHVAIARQLYFTDHGYYPDSDEELYTKQYLVRPEIPSELK